MRDSVSSASPSGARQVVVLAQDEARELKHDDIGTEHILLGRMRQGEGVAVQILLDFGADAESERDEVFNQLAGPGRADEAAELPPEPAVRIERLRTEREAAIERAADLREQEQALAREARGPPPLPPRPEIPAYETIAAARRERPERRPLVSGLLVVAAGLPLGLLAGWLIWGWH